MTCSHVGSCQCNIFTVIDGGALATSSETHRSWNLGKPHTTATRNKIAQSMREYWTSPQAEITRKKISQAMKEYSKRTKKENKKKEVVGQK